MDILAIDPGGTTGIAWGSFRKDWPLMPPEVEMKTGFEAASRCIHDHLGNELPTVRYAYWPDLIVVEKFVITGATAKKSTAGSNTAIELIGVVRFLADLYDIPVEEQSPVDAKTFCNDGKLRRLGWYIPGPDHTRDAMRHLLLAAVRHDVIDLTQLLP